MDLFSCIAEPSVVGGSLTGHTDSVWGLTYHNQRHHLLSCAADSTVKYVILTLLLLKTLLSFLVKIFILCQI